MHEGGSQEAGGAFKLFIMIRCAALAGIHIKKRRSSRGGRREADRRATQRDAKGRKKTHIKGARTTMA